MYGFEAPYTVRGFAAELDGVCIGVAGVAYTNPLACFSNIADVMKEYPRQVVEAVRAVRELLEEFDVPIYATPETKEGTADTFLHHVGFVKYHKGVYVWHKQSPT